MLSAVEITNEGQGSKWLWVLHQIACAAGYRGMIEGQMRDIASEDSEISIKELGELHALKTGARMKMN